MTELRRVPLCFAVVALAATAPGCASKILKVENSDQILENKEYDDALDVRELDPEAGPGHPEGGLYVSGDAPAYVLPPSQQAAPTTTGKGKGKTPRKGPIEKTKESKSAKAPPGPPVSPPSPVPARRQPEIEDAEGFSGRRPVVDPFRAGESVTLEASYFNVVAGDITLQVRPFKVVNGRKSYHFAGIARSTSVFAVFYAVDDFMETFVDYDDLIPYNYALDVKESKQLRKVASFFDWKKLRGYVWDRKVKPDKTVEDKKYEWEIQPFSQNVFSAPFYLRTFRLEPGKKVHYRVGHEGKNIVVTGEVLRREKLDTNVGALNTVVVKPKIEIDGVFKPIGDVYFWLTDDDRKFIVRIEAKIRIGKVVAEVKSIDRGQ